MIPQNGQPHRGILKTTRFPERVDLPPTGTLSPDITVTTSSGYSTGDSSISASIITNTKESSSSITCNRHKTKSKGFHNIINKLKNIFVSPKTKLHNSTPITTTTNEKEMRSANNCDPYSTNYDHTTSITTSNTISIPFTYYQCSPVKSKYYDKPKPETHVAKVTNFEKIAAWLNHTQQMKQDKNDNEDDDFDEGLFIEEFQEQSISPSSIDIDYQITMKKNPSLNRAPKRSTSMVATLNRPIIEQKHYERSISPTASFTSSILAKGMSDRLTPQKTPHQSRTNLTDDHTPNSFLGSNRRRIIDFTRRRTVAGSNEQFLNSSNNKENVPINHRQQQQIYRFSPATSTNMSAKKYFFYPRSSTKNEDMLMNSYGLKILQQQPQQRQNPYSKTLISKIPENSSKYSSQQQLENNRRSSIHLLQQKYTSDSLDDLLCDREVESYFYPDKRQSTNSYPQHIYINLEGSSNYYSPPPTFIHGTLC